MLLLCLVVHSNGEKTPPVTHLEAVQSFLPISPSRPTNATKGSSSSAHIPTTPHAPPHSDNAKHQPNSSTSRSRQPSTEQLQPLKAATAAAASAAADNLKLTNAASEVRKSSPVAAAGSKEQQQLPPPAQKQPRLKHDGATSHVKPVKIKDPPAVESKPVAMQRLGSSSPQSHGDAESPIVTTASQPSQQHFSKSMPRDVMSQQLDKAGASRVRPSSPPSLSAGALSKSGV